jgi:hypothetical protein
LASKIKCSRCDVDILQSTAEKNGGLCLPCANGTRDRMDAVKRFRAEQEEVRRQRDEQFARMPLYKSIEDVVLSLNSLNNPGDEDELLHLELTLNSISTLPSQEIAAPALLSIFERFPWSDGFETFWGILHALEGILGYESLLVSSVRRSPGKFNLLMINRLLNGRVYSVDGLELLDLLREVAQGSDARASAPASSFLEYQLSNIALEPTEDIH